MQISKYKHKKIDEWIYMYIKKMHNLLRNFKIILRNSMPAKKLEKDFFKNIDWFILIIHAPVKINQKIPQKTFHYEMLVIWDTVQFWDSFVNLLG